MDTYSSILRKFSHLLKDQDPLKAPRTWYRYGNGGYLHGNRYCRKHVHVHVIESTALETSCRKTCAHCWHKPLEDILGQLACLTSVASVSDKLEYIRKVSLDTNITVERLGKCLHELDLIGLKLDSLRKDAFVDLVDLTDDYHKAREIVRVYAGALLENMPGKAVADTMRQHRNGISSYELMGVTDLTESIPSDTIESMHYAWCSARVLSCEAAKVAALEIFDKHYQHVTRPVAADAGRSVNEQNAMSSLGDLTALWETIYLNRLKENSLRPYVLTGLRYPIVSDKVSGTFYMYGAKYGKNRQTSVCIVPPSVGHWLTHSTHSDKVVVVGDLAEADAQCLDIVAAIWEPLETGSVYSNLKNAYSAGCRI